MEERYEFRLFSEELRHDVNRLLYAAGIEVVELGEHPSVPLWGYYCMNEVVAWAWGSRTGQEGDLHLAVAESHRNRGLALRLALRYILTRNHEVDIFHFVLTETGRAAFHNRLSGLGFTIDSDGNYFRLPFSGDDLAQLTAQASALDALQASFRM